MAKRILIGIDEERLGRAMKAIEELPTRSRTARDIAELIDEPVYVAYEALRHLGYRVDRDYVASQVGTAEERVPLFERIAQIDTSDMTVPEIAERFGASELRVRNALTFLRRFAKTGGYKTLPRKRPTQASKASTASGAASQSRQAAKKSKASVEKEKEQLAPPPQVAEAARPRADEVTASTEKRVAAARRKLRLRFSTASRVKGMVRRDD